MAYVPYATVAASYSDVTEADYNRLGPLADRELDRQTTGIDNVRKLRDAFPADEGDAAIVCACEAELIHLLLQIEEAEAAATAAGSYTQRSDGSYVSGALASISSGSESMSFATASAAPKTPITAAAMDEEARDKLIADRIRRWLSGVTDANGVNLLYRGAYPYCIATQ